MRLLSTTAIFLSIVVTAGPTGAQCLSIKLTGSDTGSGDAFGDGVSVYGITAATMLVNRSPVGYTYLSYAALSVVGLLIPIRRILG